MGENGYSKPSTARNLLLAERSRKLGLGGIHGGEKVLGGGGTALEEVDHALRFGCGLGDWFGSKIVAEHGSEGGDADARG